MLLTEVNVLKIFYGLVSIKYVKDITELAKMNCAALCELRIKHSGLSTVTYFTNKTLSK